MNRIGGAARTGDLIAYEMSLQQLLHAADSLEELKITGAVNIATLDLEATCGRKPGEICASWNSDVSVRNKIICWNSYRAIHCSIHCLRISTFCRLLQELATI